MSEQPRRAQAREVLEVVEGMAARLCAARLSDAQRRRLEDLLRQPAFSAGAGGPYERDLRVRRYLLTHCGNALLAPLAESMRREAETGPISPSVSLRPAAEAVLRREPDAADRHMRRYIGALSTHANSQA